VAFRSVGVSSICSAIYIGLQVIIPFITYGIHGNGYIYLHEWLICMANEGKYTVRPMDQWFIGNNLFCVIESVGG